MSDLHSAPRLETARLILRAWRDEDVEPFIAMMAEAEVARFLTAARHPLDRAAAWSHLALLIGHWALCGYGLFAVEEKRSGAFVGRVGGWRPEGRADVELGWGLARAYWGEGYAAEAARAAGSWMFEARRAPALASYIHPGNTRSRKLAERLGMARAGEILHAGALHEVWRVDRAGWTG